MSSALPQVDPVDAPKPPQGDSSSSTASSMMSDLKKTASDAASSVGKPTSGAFDKITGHSAFKEQVLELQRWDQPFNSALVVAAVTFVFVMTQGEEAYSPINLLCYVLMIRLGLVTSCRYALSATEGPEKLRSLRKALTNLCDGLEKWLPIPDQKQVANVIGGSASLLEAKVNGACKSMDEATKPTAAGWKSFKVVLAHLAGAIVVFKIFTLYTLMYLTFMHQMLWPALYQRNQEKIDEVSAKVWTQIEPHVEAAKAKIQEIYVKVEAIVSEKFHEVKDKLNNRAANKTSQPTANKTE